MNSWRLIIEGPREAAYNMAADTYLLEAAEKPGSIPVVRLYEWKRPSITIGYHQDPGKAVDINRLEGTPIVRRITGGRALLHDSGEITYSVSGDFERFPELGRDLKTAYLKIAEIISGFYGRFGINVSISGRTDPYRVSKKERWQRGCLATVSRYEISLSGSKLSAGAQRRRSKTFLQHGVIRIKPPQSHPAITLPKMPAYPFENIPQSRSGLISSLVEGFEVGYEINFTRNDFSDIEREKIDKIKKACTIDNNWQNIVKQDV